MSEFRVVYYPAALKDLERLDGSQQAMVLKAMEKVRANPLPQSKGGFGKPLGNKSGTKLTNFMKVKLRGSGLRIVYRLVEIRGEVAVIVVGAREDNDAYKTAEKRIAGFERWLEGL